MSLQEKSRPEDAIRTFINDGLITEVLHAVKSGKEATVFCCRANQDNVRNDTYAKHRFPLLAAKVYRPREQRAFRDDSVYRAGRVITNARNRRAARSRSDWGRQVLFGSWVGEEFQTLQLLHAAGADVPAPIACSGNVMIMEYIGDEEEAAPLLVHAQIKRAEAQPLFEQVLRNIQVFLMQDRVHSDLSPFNILYWRGAVKVIDFPQTVDARTNPNAYSLLQRDVENVCRYFERHGVHSDPGRLTHQLWSWYLYGAQAG